jgi:hypothetical protein
VIQCDPANQGTFWSKRKKRNKEKSSCRHFQIPLVAEKPLAVRFLDL